MQEVVFIIGDIQQCVILDELVPALRFCVCVSLFTRAEDFEDRSVRHPSICNPLLFPSFCNGVTTRHETTFAIRFRLTFPDHLISSEMKEPPR